MCPSAKVAPERAPKPRRTEPEGDWKRPVRGLLRHVSGGSVDLGGTSHSPRLRPSGRASAAPSEIGQTRARGWKATVSSGRGTCRQRGGVSKAAERVAASLTDAFEQEMAVLGIVAAIARARRRGIDVTAIPRGRGPGDSGQSSGDENELDEDRRRDPDAPEDARRGGAVPVFAWVLWSKALVYVNQYRLDGCVTRRWRLVSFRRSTRERRSTRSSHLDSGTS